MTATVLFALAAALSSAVNLIAQHRASITAPTGVKGVRLVRYLFRSPSWLFGWLAALAGFAFHALALHNGQLSVVQPLMVTELVFVLILRRVWIRQKIIGPAWASVAVICVSLAAFLSVAEPQGGNPTPSTVEWVSAIGVFTLAIAVITLLGRRGSEVRRAAMFAIAASLTFALLATFLKATTDALAQFGLTSTLTRWPVYALVASGVVGTFLQQAALHVGPLSVSQPLLVILDPFASIVLSVWLFNETFTASPGRISIAVVSFSTMALGVIGLTRWSPGDLDRRRLVASQPIAP